jgi:type I restriction enzyme M protein
MALKKSELYASLWKSCDELRGGMDASQYKDYVLVLLFVKYVSDKYANDPDALIEVPLGGRFADMVAAKGDKEIGDRINKIVARLADANDQLKGAITLADFNDESKLGQAKEMVDRLSKLVAIFEGLDFGGNRAEGDDLLGDAYEYLMRHFATESGKSKGQFYTPAEVSRLMSQVIDLNGANSGAQTLYDPACGSGSLLLKAHDQARNTTGLDLTLYGQEMDNATAALARMNMVLHDCPTAEICQANTMSNPHFKDAMGGLKTFDFVVANFPFSVKNWTSGLDPVHDLFNRFEFGIPPAKNGDYAFLLHILKSLKSTGKGAVIHPHGVLFRGGAEAVIRKRVVQQGFIKGIIGLPANLFFGTGIPACLLVVDKEGATGRKGIFMIDASRGFIKDGNKNRLRAQDIHKIADTFNRQIEIDRYSRLVPLAEIEANDFNLNLPRYIDSSEPEDRQDIEAHLKGGIPNADIDGLSAYWQVFPGVRQALFSAADRPGYSQLTIPATEIKPAIFDHPEFTAFNQRVTEAFQQWHDANRPRLTSIRIGDRPEDRPKALIETLSEKLLEAFRADARIVGLVDPYDIYQHLLDYWTATMLDDVWMLAADGWTAMQAGKPNTDLIPPALIVARYYFAEQAAIEQLETERDALGRELEELDEEHGGDEAALSSAKDAKGKITRRSINLYRDALVESQLDAHAYNHWGYLFKAAKITEPSTKESKKQAREAKVKMAELWSQAEQLAEQGEDFTILVAYEILMAKESAADRAVKEAQKALDVRVTAHYAQLTEAEIQTLVVDDKWLAALAASVQGELDRVSQTLTSRIRQLAERYATPLPRLAEEVDALAARVDEHLKTMGFAWK